MIRTALILLLALVGMIWATGYLPELARLIVG